MLLSNILIPKDIIIIIIIVVDDDDDDDGGGGGVTSRSLAVSPLHSPRASDCVPLSI
jgi:hypothetical protein